MRGTSELRRDIGGMLRLLVAALWLAAQGLAQAAAMPAQGPSADSIERLALQTLCHGAPTDDGAPAPAPLHHDCLLCPACHLAAHAAVLAGGAPALPLPVQPLIGRAAPPPASTGPPPLTRRSAQPTGPPDPSA